MQRESSRPVLVNIKRSFRRVGHALQRRGERYLLNLAERHHVIPAQGPRGVLYHVPSPPADRKRDSVIKELDRTVEDMRGQVSGRIAANSDGAVTDLSAMYRWNGPGAHLRNAVRRDHLGMTETGIPELSNARPPSSKYELHVDITLQKETRAGCGRDGIPCALLAGCSSRSGRIYEMAHSPKAGYRIATLHLSTDKSLIEEMKDVLVSNPQEEEPEPKPETETEMETEIETDMQACVQVLKSAKARQVQIHSLARPLPLGQHSTAPSASVSVSVPMSSTTRPHHFDWPRWIDSNYEDPAASWSREWREKKRERERKNK